MSNRIKRFLSIILMCSVLVGVCGIGFANASGEKIIVSADPIIVQAGDQFEIPIQMSGGQGIMGFSVSFTYDETAMKPISVAPAGDVEGGWENSIETSKTNTFSVVWYGTENITAQGTVFTLKFEAKPYAAGEYTIQVDYDQASTFNEAWQDVVLQTGAIDVRIDNEHPSPEFVIQDATIVAGEEYSCDVSVRKNTGFGVVAFTLSYDPTALTPTKIQPRLGRILSNNLNGSSGTVQVVLDQVSADSGDGVLFAVLFTTAPNRKGSFPISMTNSADYVCKPGSVTLNKDVPAGIPIVNIQEDLFTANNIITVPIHISNNTGIMGMRLQISLDSTKFELTNCERGSALDSGWFDYLYDSSAGKVDILWSSSEASFANGVCCILKIQIKDKSANCLALSIDYEQEDTFDELLKNVKLACKNAEIPIHCLVIQSEATSINVGETLQLTATMLYSDGQPETVSWSSSNSYVASIDESGMIHGLRRGIVDITADDGDGHTATISIQILPIKPELQLFSFDGSFEQKIDWWKRYSTATMKMSFIAYKCEDVVRYEWSSNSRRVHIDQEGNVTNTGCFARSAKLTLIAYDAAENVVASSTVTVRFYKFNWQYRRLQSQEIVSDNVFRSTVEPTATEPETFVSFITACLSKVIWPFIR